MPRQSHAVPKYRKHRASGQAIVTLAGKDHYLGPHGTQASKLLYDRLIAEYLAANRQTEQIGVREVRIAVVQILAAFWKHCKAYYLKDGRPTTEQHAFRLIIKDLRKLYGSLPAEDFGPKALKALRFRWIERGQSRNTVNQNARRVTRIFRWAAEEELISASVYQGLQAVAGLRKGRSTARESEPVLPVHSEVVETTLQYLQPIVGDMIQVQLLTGMRPNEVCNLRSCDIDRSEDIWEYCPYTHKTEHHARIRTIPIGPRAQGILKPYLDGAPENFCFSAEQSVQVWLAAKTANRKTPASCGNRPGSNRKRKPKRSPRGQYTVSSYRRAIHRACDRAFPPPEHLSRRPKETRKQWFERLGPEGVKKLKQWQSEHRWSPNQLRHSAATTIRKRFGLEAAQVILGHAAADVTQVYAERDLEKARQVIREIG